MDARIVSARARKRLLIAALVGASTYAAYRAWRDQDRIRRGIDRTISTLQRCTETAVTRATACIVAGTIQGVAAVRPQAVDAPAPEQPWQAMALEKLLGLLTTRAGMDLVSLAVAVGAQHSTAAALQHFSSGQRDLRHSTAPRAPPEATTARVVATAVGGSGSVPTNVGRPHAAGALPAGMPSEQDTSNPIVAQLLTWAASPQGERFVVAAMAAAARNSTRAYMDSLAGGNTYDDLFAAAFRPEHRAVLRDLTTMATREAVATYLCPPQPTRNEGASSDSIPLSSDSDGASWTDTLQNLSQGSSTLIKQVTSNSRAAAVAIPVLMYASSKGLALGCKDALTRTRFTDAPTDLLPSKVTVVDAALKLLWLLLSLVVLVVAAGIGARAYLVHGPTSAQASLMS